VSALLILESIMEKMRDHEPGIERMPLPYEYFDVMGGTSTGGYGSLTNFSGS
jgi:hypothetical protein